MSWVPTKNGKVVQHALPFIMLKQHYIQWEASWLLVKIFKLGHWRFPLVDMDKFTRFYVVVT